MRAPRFLKLLLDTALKVGRGLTTPTWTPTWKQLAGEINGELLPPSLRQMGGCVRVNYRNFSIELSNIHGETRWFTRVMTRLATDSDFKFSIYRAGFFSKVGDQLGLPRFLSGDRDLDDKFRVTGNLPMYLTALLRSAAVRERLLQLPEMHFSLSPLLKHQSFRLTGQELSGTSVLQVDTHELVTDLVQLKRLFELQERTIDVFLEVGLIQSSATTAT